MKDKTLKYKEQICNFVFEDNCDNVIKNLSIINYAYINNLIERKEKYKDLLKMFALLSSKNLEVLKAFNPDKKLTETLYDAYKEVQYNAFKNIKDSLYVFDDNDLDENLSKNTVKVYNIKKNNEKLLISTSRILKKSDENTDKLLQNINFRSSRKILQDYKSLSYVSNKKLKTYRNLSEYVTFVYPNNIPNEYLITINNDDAWIKFNKEGLPTSTEKPFYKETEKLLNNTQYFNEIAILRNDNYNEEETTLVKPCALFCVGEITEIEYEIAKELNLNIIFSESKYKYIDFEVSEKKENYNKYY